MSHASELGRMTGSLVFEKHAANPFNAWNPANWFGHNSRMRAPVHKPGSVGPGAYALGQRQQADAAVKAIGARRFAAIGGLPNAALSSADWRRRNQQRL